MTIKSIDSILSPNLSKSDSKPRSSLQILNQNYNKIFINENAPRKSINKSKEFMYQA